MLKKQNRLSSTFEYNVTRKYGSKIDSPYFVIYFLKPTNYQGPTKIGIVVSTKIHKRAVKRNYLKRIFRSMTEVFVNMLPVNTWIVIQPKKLCLDSTYEKISTDFNKALQKNIITH